VSSLDLVVLRHGDTFEPGAPVTWVGRREDPPLARRGRAQAETFGRTLAAAGWAPERVLVSALERSRRHGALVCEAAPFRAIQPEIEPRLDEIDYGPWGGLTSAEIEARGDGPALALWSDEALWPAAFAESEGDVRARVQGLAHELAAAAATRPAGSGTQRVLLVSSNGVMRYLLDLVPGELERRRAERTFKVATGRHGRLAFDGARWHLAAWNLPPESPPRERSSDTLTGPKATGSKTTGPKANGSKTTGPKATGSKTTGPKATGPEN